MKRLISSITIAITMAIVFETPSFAIFVMMPSADLRHMKHKPAHAPKRVSPQRPPRGSVSKNTISLPPKNTVSLPPKNTKSLALEHTKPQTQKRVESLPQEYAGSLTQEHAGSLTHKRAESFPQKQYAELIGLIKEHLEINTAIKQHLDKNMVEQKKARIVRAVDDTNFFLKHPELIYDKNEDSDILALVEKIRKEETSDSINVERQFINKRSKNAAIVDKAVSLQTFQEAEKRFHQILGLLDEISKTEDLKSIAELQAQIKGRLAMIQNETAKLQMVAHLRNAEQMLISQQKRERNMKMLNSKNTVMPTIRFIR
ncbi:type IV secretion system protein [Bartonella sp. CB74]|uniref:type IV secretion system protein n=1 Tax=Bartonella sp. CB74 TaxID=3113620 RepID=UPI002F96507A